MIDADSFYAKMPKKEPPRSGRAGARSGFPAPELPPATVSRDVDAADEAADGGEELSAQERDEQRRQREADMAERMYGDLPSGDGVRYDEPELTSPNEFSLEVPDDLRANLGEGEAQQITSAFIEAGVGRTMANDLVRQGIEASRRGLLSDAQIEQRNADGMQVLEQRWGDRTAEKLQLAKGMIDEASQRWPGLKNYLNATGLGSDPKLIQQLVARAERRP